MIRVLHVVHTFQTGGAERVVLDLTRRGTPSVENYVCSLCDAHDLASQLDRSRVGFACLHKAEGNDPRVIGGLTKLIAQEKIDVVHAQGWGTFIESLVATKLSVRRRPAFIFAFHGKSMEDLVRAIPLRQRMAQRVAHWFTDACVAPARQMADDYARTIGIRRDRIEVIYNGIDLTRFAREARDQTRAALGLDARDFVVGFVGRLDPVKDVRGLVEVFSRVRQSLSSGRTRARLLVVGEGPERQAAESLASEKGLGESVLFTGRRRDVPQCMAAMDVYLQPSYFEGHSIAILEAMASRLPVVSTLVGGTPEIISNGHTGFLFGPGDYEQMAAAVMRLCQQPTLAAAVGRAGFERVAQHFSAEVMVRRYEDLYHRVTHTAYLPCAA